jgi:hypothetical protein
MHGLIVAAMFALGASRAFAVTEIWVSPSGHDENPGTSAAPVATLVRAQELERAALKQNAQEGVTVQLLPGDYTVPAGWALTPEDSGAEGAPVVWRSTEPGKARLLGCRPVAPDKWTPLDDPSLVDRLAPSAKGHVLQIDFADAGLGEIKPMPDYSREPALPVQLYHRDEALPLARWPHGRYGYTTLLHVVDNGGNSGGAPEGGAFVYREDEPARWVAALEDEKVWLRGFWRVPWVAETLRVKAIDPGNKTITLAAAASGGLGSKYVKDAAGKRVGSGKENWFALNLLEEIVAPGDWSIDFKRGKIYLWPPDNGVISISGNTAPLVSITKANFVELRGLSLGWTAGAGVKIEGGRQVTVASCHLSQIAGEGVVISGGWQHALLGNDLDHLGLSAIDVTGGDRATLTPCRDEICNNAITDVAMDSPAPALVAGLDAMHQNVVGVHIAHNRIDGASYSGITFAGNDNLLEYNEIYRIGLDGGDLGAFYTTGGWTSRGNIVRYNFIHHAENANGIYMDDGDSGLQAYGNLIVKVESGFLVGGGHDHLIRNNLIVGADHAIHLDDRGFSRHYTADDHRLRGDFDSVPVSSAPWAKEYPGLADFLKSDPRMPSNDIIDHNIAVQCTGLFRRSGTDDHLAGYRLTNDAELPSADIFKDPRTLDYHLKDPAALNAVAPGFEPVPLEQMGLQVDSNRAAIPPRDLDQLNNESTAPRKFDSQQDIDSSRKNP